MRVWPGQPFPLGATWDGEGVNFALFSHNASGVELCLFSRDNPRKEVARVAVRESTNKVWHAYLPDVRPGQLYGYRVDGPYAPQEGLRFNPHKLLVDPYARALSGPVVWDDVIFGYRINDQEEDGSRDERDSAAVMPKCVVIDSTFPWDEDISPRVPWQETVIYECHVKGMTMLHPKVPDHLRGKYLGVASEPIIEHLLSLGVTAVELLPVHHSVSEQHLAQKGLSNYWGYNPIALSAPDSRYATGALGEQVLEFKSMVKRLHRAGLEVILDVVFNHTAEGGRLGPTLSLKGIDNSTYYRLLPNDRREYEDFSGCGNSLNATEDATLRLVLDSLRYWAQEMRVDGFRFDLAPVLARDPHAVNMRSRFLSLIHQDPTLSRLKLIAEAWDLGEGGYQLGRFPVGWAEWNDRYRDAARAFWRNDGGMLPELAYRLTGSSDLYQLGGRTPHASINHVTSHDGFTLTDLVSYERKHNEANQEGNLDGHNHNLSHNWGAEGPTTAPGIQKIRERMKRNFLATLAFSQGVPMILGGDELGRTQHGNNNCYCQDNLLSYYNWELGSEQKDLLAFARRVFSIRKANPVFHRRNFFAGKPIAGNSAKDISWLRPDGREMGHEDWRNPKIRALGMLLPGRAADAMDERGRPNFGRTALLLVNPAARGCHFVLPEVEDTGVWRELVCTSGRLERLVKTRSVNLPPHTLALLVHGVPRPYDAA